MKTYQSYRVECGDGRALLFCGDLIAAVDDSQGPHGLRDRWHDLALYRTQDGQLVCSRVVRTCWQGETETCDATVCADDAGVVAFFGLGSLAKELYTQARIDPTVYEP
jgi:hypothetical protein